MKNAMISLARRELLGLTLDEAQEQAQARGWRLRTVEEDGRQLGRSMDHDPTRANVVVRSGFVISVLDFG